MVAALVVGGTQTREGAGVGGREREKRWREDLPRWTQKASFSLFADTSSKQPWELNM